MTTATTASTATNCTTTAQPHAGALITDQLNIEWATLADRPIPRRWRCSGLGHCATLGEALAVVDHARWQRPGAADALLLELLTRWTYGDELAGRLILQSTLGRAINIARRAHRPGSAGIQGDIAQLTAAAVAALWHAIAAYPVHRRRRKVSVNLCMDALRYFSTTLDDPGPVTVGESALDSEESIFAQTNPAPTLELLNTLAWGVDTDAISREEASLLTRVYCPGPGQEGGAGTVAHDLGLTAATVRQRCRRATARLASAVHSSDALHPRQT